MDIRDHLVCPECKVRLEGTERLRCRSCGRIFAANGNFFNLLPLRLSREDFAEEQFWATDPKEGLNSDPRLTLTAKKIEMTFFRERILPNVDLKGKILEIGSGACWLSSLVKLASPEAFIVASDVSTSALRKGERVSQLLKTRIDAYVTCKIESLPFEDGLFDWVIGSAVLHHTEPREALIQVFRVLSNRGRFIGTGETIIPRRLSPLWSSRLGFAGRREKQLGVKEGSFSYAQWKSFFDQAGFHTANFSLRMDPQYKQGGGLVNFYYQIVSRIPQVFVLTSLACVAVVVANK